MVSSKILKRCFRLGLAGGILAIIFGFAFVALIFFAGVPPVFFICGIAMAVLGLIDVICACASKKSQGARIAMIVFGSLGILSGLFTPLSLPGILVLAGGIAGVASRKAERQGGAAEGVQERVDGGKIAAEGGAGIAQGAVVAEGPAGGTRGVLWKFKSKFVGDEAKKTKTAVFVLLTVFYAILLALSLTIFFTHCFGAFNAEGGEAGDMIALAYAMITPTYFVYFGSHNPFDFGKKAAKALVVLGIMATVCCAAVGIYLIFTSYIDVVEPVVCIFVSFALLLADAGYIFAFVGWCRGLPSAWYAGIGIAGIILFPLAAVLAVIAFVLYIILFFIRGFFSVAKTGFSDNSFVQGFKSGYSGTQLPENAIQINDGGYTRTLVPEGYDYGHVGASRYKFRDDLGRYWYSEDGGRTFYRDK